MFCAENEGGHKARVLVEACCRLCSRDGMSKEKNHKKRKKRKPRICLILTSPVPSRSCWRKARFNSKTSSSLIFVTWLIHTYDMTHPHMWHDSFIHVSRLIHICDMTHSYMNEAKRSFQFLHLVVADVCMHHSNIAGQTLYSRQRCLLIHITGTPILRRRWYLYARVKCAAKEYKGSSSRPALLFTPPQNAQHVSSKEPCIYSKEPHASS